MPHPLDDLKDQSKPKRLKRNLTLDLENANYTPPFGVPILSTPDVNKCNLSSLEIERIIKETGPILPTPSTPRTQVLFPQISLEDEDYSLSDSQNSEDSNRSGTPVTTTLPKSSDSTLEPCRFEFDETQSFNGSKAPASPSSAFDVNSCKSELCSEKEFRNGSGMNSLTPLVPVNIENLERIKLERKRMRNREAASKCRQRKLERISQLEDTVKKLRSENSDLAGIAKSLKEDVCKLKENVMMHAHSGCSIDIPKK